VFYTETGRRARIMGGIGGALATLTAAWVAALVIGGLGFVHLPVLRHLRPPTLVARADANDVPLAIPVSARPETAGSAELAISKPACSSTQEARVDQQSDPSASVESCRVRRG